MIVIRHRVTDHEIIEESANAITQIERWFKLNPRRKVCVTEIWYDKQMKVRRGHVRQDIEAARDEALARNKR